MQDTNVMNVSEEAAALEVPAASEEALTLGTLAYDDKVIEKIAGLAVNEIPGILALDGGLVGSLTDMIGVDDDPTRGINAEVGKKQAAIDLTVICEYGVSIPEIYQSVSEIVATRIKEMTGLDVIEVNMNVKDIMTKEAFNASKSGKKNEENRAPALTGDNRVQ